MRMHKMQVDRQYTPVTRHLYSSQQSKDLLQVELDIGPVFRTCSSSSSGGPGPSPLSSSSFSCPLIMAGSSSPAPAGKSCIRTAGEIKTTLGKGQEWKQKAEDALWLASAFFILFYGDFRSNFFSLLASDPRIGRAPLRYGTAILLINVLMLLLFLAAQPRSKRSSLKKLLPDEYIITTAPTVFTLLGFAAFVMLSVALWPVWYFLTVPLLFTLFMAVVVVSSYALPCSRLLSVDGTANNSDLSFANYLSFTA